jgi:Na+/melibiose symporter-like transporter
MFCDVAEGDDIWRYLAIACLSIGALATLIFLVGVKEEPTPLKSRHDRNYVEWRAWFKNRYFYFVTFVCLCMRLTVNVTQVSPPPSSILKLKKVYLVAFSLSSLQLGENSKAFMPLALYLASLLTSFVMKPAAKRFDLRVIFFVGAIFACTGLVPMLLLSIFQLDGSLPERVNLASYGFIILFGFANSALIVTALSMEAKLVGDHSESSAFVYGFISFTDKFSNGIAVFVINQFVQDSGSESAAIAFGKNIAYVFALVPSASAVLGSFFAMMCKFDERPKFFRLRSDEIEDK